MHVRDDRPVLTYSQLREWQRRIAEIAVQAAALQAESLMLGHKLDAAKVIIGGDLPLDDEAELATQASVPEELDKDETGDPFPEVVLKAVAALGGAPKPSDIKQWITKYGTGAAPHKATQAYFYTVLMRHARAGRLIKEGDRYRLPTSSPEGETGGWAPPADSIA